MRIIESTKQNVLTVSLLMFVITLFAGCEQNPVSPPSQELTVNGRVTGENASQATIGVRNAKISVARIAPDGSFSVVDPDQAVTDASGNFSTKVESDDTQPMVLIARTDSDEWEALISGAAGAGQSEIQSVVNFESSAEAMVYSRIVQAGEQSRVSLSLLRDYIGPEEARMIRNNHQAIGRFVKAILAHVAGQASMRITAIISDSTSYVHLKNRFLVQAADDSTLVDSIIAHVRMDPATVDSLLEIYTADSTGNEHDGDHRGMQKAAHRDHPSGDDDGEYHDRELLKINTFPNEHMPSADTSLVAVKVRYMFTSDSTSRADLVAAIARRTQLTRAQVVNAMKHPWGDDEAHEGDDDHGGHDGDWPEAHEYAGAETEIHSSITLSQGTLDLVDSLTTELNTDSLPAGENELKFMVKKADSQLSVSQDLAVELTADQMDLWNAILEAVKSEVSDAAASDAYVKIEWELHGSKTTTPVPMPSGV